MEALHEVTGEGPPVPEVATGHGPAPSGVPGRRALADVQSGYPALEGNDARANAQTPSGPKRRGLGRHVDATPGDTSHHRQRGWRAFVKQTQLESDSPDAMRAQRVQLDVHADVSGGGRAGHREAAADCPEGGGKAPREARIHSAQGPGKPEGAEIQKGTLLAQVHSGEEGVGGVAQVHHRGGENNLRRRHQRVHPRLAPEGKAPARNALFPLKGFQAHLAQLSLVSAEARTAHGVRNAFRCSRELGHGKGGRCHLGLARAKGAMPAPGGPYTEVRPRTGQLKTGGPASPPKASTMRLEDMKKVLQGLGPRSLKRLGGMRLSAVVLQESRRAKKRVGELKTRYPSAAARKLAQHLIEQKKQVAALVGGISGAFGLVGIPADWVAMAVLEVQLLVDIATAYEVRLEFARSRQELLDVLGTANGVGALGRAGPKVVGKLAQVLFERGGLASLGRAFPLVAAPVTSSVLNTRDIQVWGRGAAALRGFRPRLRRSAPPNPEEALC